jgi:hypothetical protein
VGGGVGPDQETGVDEIVNLFIWSSRHLVISSSGHFPSTEHLVIWSFGGSSEGQIESFSHLVIPWRLSASHMTR